jgi:hypothetical protein
LKIVCEPAPANERALKILRHARALLETEGAWIQHAMARNPDGVESAWNDDTACQFDLSGAFHRAARYHTLPLKDVRLARDLILEVADCESIVRWNDAEGRTQAEVLAALDEAIKRAEFRASVRESPYQARKRKVAA